MGICERRPSREQTLGVQEVESADPGPSSRGADPGEWVTASVSVCDGVSAGV